MKALLPEVTKSEEFVSLLSRGSNANPFYNQFLDEFTVDNLPAFEATRPSISDYVKLIEQIDGGTQTSAVKKAAFNKLQDKSDFFKVLFAQNKRGTALAQFDSDVNNGFSVFQKLNPPPTIKDYQSLINSASDNVTIRALRNVALKRVTSPSEFISLATQESKTTSGGLGNYLTYLDDFIGDNLDKATKVEVKEASGVSVTTSASRADILSNFEKLSQRANSTLSRVKVAAAPYIENYNELRSILKKNSDITLKNNYAGDANSSLILEMLPKLGDSKKFPVKTEDWNYLIENAGQLGLETKLKDLALKQIKKPQEFLDVMAIESVQRTFSSDVNQADRYLKSKLLEFEKLNPSPKDYASLRILAEDKKLPNTLEAVKLAEQRYGKEVPNFTATEKQFYDLNRRDKVLVKRSSDGAFVPGEVNESRVYEYPPGKDGPARVVTTETLNKDRFEPVVAKKNEIIANREVFYDSPKDGQVIGGKILKVDRNGLATVDFPSVNPVRKVKTSELPQVLAELSKSKPKIQKTEGAFTFVQYEKIPRKVETIELGKLYQKRKFESSAGAASQDTRKTFFGLVDTKEPVINAPQAKIPAEDLENVKTVQKKVYIRGSGPANVEIVGTKPANLDAQINEAVATRDVGVVVPGNNARANRFAKKMDKKGIAVVLEDDKAKGVTNQVLTDPEIKDAQGNVIKEKFIAIDQSKNGLEQRADIIRQFNALNPDADQTFFREVGFKGRNGFTNLEQHDVLLDDRAARVLELSKSLARDITMNHNGATLSEIDRLEKQLAKKGVDSTDRLKQIKISYSSVVNQNAYEQVAKELVSTLTSQTKKLDRLQEVLEQGRGDFDDFKDGLYSFFMSKNSDKRDLGIVFKVPKNFEPSPSSDRRVRQYITKYIKDAKERNANILIEVKRTVDVVEKAKKAGYFDGFGYIDFKNQLNKVGNLARTKEINFKRRPANK